MAEILNVSRTPVRSAIARLVNEGLLEKKRKKGCIIPSPEPEDARQVFQAREILEGTVAGLAAKNRTESDVAELWKILEQETKALQANKKDEYYLSNEKFHFTLFKSAKNKYFERYCKHLFRRTSVYIFYFDSFYTSGDKLKKVPRQRTPGQHMEIAKAVEKGNARQAEKIMKEHVRYSYKVLLGL
jgi:DNA-binding GntR family transcriptional regulator